MSKSRSDYLENGVKPRYDNGGSEFGLAHRDLPRSCTMFDVDRLDVDIKLHLVADKQDYSFIEYRTDFNNDDVDFIALFEVKYKSSQQVKNQFKTQKKGTATFAQKLMCQKLDMRYFYVIATEGDQPFYFVEIGDNIHKRKNYKYIGKLSYNDENRREKITRFWKEKLKLL